MADQANTGVMAGALTAFSGAAATVPGFADGGALRVKRARSERFAPQSFTGCVSEISSGSEDEHFHADAFKRYAQVYQDYQAYLMPTDPLAAHDYELGARGVAAGSGLGCLEGNLVGDTLQHDDISDDDIERCGYMAWLHH